MGVKFRKGNIGKEIDEDNVEKITGYTAIQLISFVGIDPEAVISYNFRGKYPNVNIGLQTEQVELERIFHFADDSITNLNFEVSDKDDRQQGIGTSVVSMQVVNAWNAGFKTIGLYAACVKNVMVGYYAWGVMGFSMVNDALTEFETFMKKHKRTESNLAELLATQKGRDFWKKYGFSWDGEFNLNPKSANNETLNNYKRKYGL